MRIAFSPPDISDLEIAEVVEVLKSGWITTGAKTKQFEKRIAEYCGTSRAVCLSSATAALEMTLRILGIGPGDEVITSAYTYTASASVIDHVGAKIVLVDVAPGSFHMDYEKLAEAITERTKAIIPVDIGGVMCDYDAFYRAVESKKHLYRPGENEYQRLFDRPIVMADAAHSFGATYHGKKSGAVADFSCFSFHAVKNLTTAEGGAVTWRNREGLDNDELYNKFMLWSLHGQSKDALKKLSPGSWEYDIVYPGYKCNMTDITAAIGLAQLSRFDGLMEKRKHFVKMYDQRLLPLGIQRLKHFGGFEFEGNGHLYLTRIPGITESKRNDIIVKMAEAGVACNVHFKPLPMHTAYQRLGFDVKDYPNAYRQYANEITLPLHTLLQDEEVDYIAETLKAILQGRKS
ncbi:MAG: DegT/DnrJ/EryC1/StrS family aminotransferase [Clostridia bacterium]|nr:DegT/DnrJ/EryC1/StrS family aminotransferase [Clostridia bacterium]